MDIVDARFGPFAALAALAVLSFVVGRGLRTWLDTGRFGWPPAQRLGWALVGALTPARYWWEARINALPQAEKEALLRYETRLLWLEQADSLRCPLCRAEIPNAWVLDEDGQVTVGPGPVQCPRCDFRLDACRHCAHFLPGAPQPWHAAAWNQPDGTWGRCGYYKRSQPVDDAVDPEMARALKRQGYEEIRAPMRIADSMMRPDFCRAFSFDPRRSRRISGVRRPGRKRAALMRILEEQRRRT